MQKINFLTHFFLKILQRNSKLVAFLNLGMPGPTHLKWWYQFEETFDVYLQDKKSTSSFMLSLRYCNDITNVLFFVLWAWLATHTQSDTINLKRTFVFISRQKVNFILHVFLEILQRYANFSFGVLWACLAMHTLNDSINL